MQILVTSQGSTGDIYPMLRLCQALQNAGHHVIYATFPAFQKEIESAGIEFFSLPPAYGKEELVTLMRDLQAYRSPLTQLTQLYRWAAPHLEAMNRDLQPLIERADVVVSSYLFPLAKLNPNFGSTPHLVVAFAHNAIPSREYPPPPLPRLSWLPPALQRTWVRFLWHSADRTLERFLSRTLRKHGPYPEIRLRNFFSAPADRVLIAVSPQLVRGTWIDSNRFKTVGYCRYQPPENAYLENELAHFSQGQPMAIMTLGSMAFANADKLIQQFASRWPSHRKLILQSGWADFKLPHHPPNIKIIGPCNHDQLFRHASVIIHHGGAGTTASALFAGKPQLIIPHIADQRFFAREIIRLGVGESLEKMHWPKNLARRFLAMEPKLPDYLSRAQALAQKLHQEDGPAQAVKEIEALVRESTSG